MIFDALLVAEYAVNWVNWVPRKSGVSVPCYNPRIIELVGT